MINFGQLFRFYELTMLNFVPNFENDEVLGSNPRGEQKIRGGFFPCLQACGYSYLIHVLVAGDRQEVPLKLAEVPERYPGQHNYQKKKKCPNLFILQSCWSLVL